MKNLRELLVLDCGPIESLAPLRGVPLETLFFYESTNIRDGDLGVLLDLPHLKGTAFADRRHYSHKLKEIEAVLATRVRL